MGAWNCQTVSGSGLGNAVWRAAQNMEMNSCICNWKRDRKMSKSVTVGEAESVTAHEVINTSITRSASAVPIDASRVSGRR